MANSFWHMTISVILKNDFDSETLVTLRMNGLWQIQVTFEFVTSHRKVTLASKNPINSSYRCIMHS